MTEYTVVWAPTIIDLVNLIKGHIKEGWKPTGGVAYSDENGLFYQAMVR